MIGSDRVRRSSGQLFDAVNSLCWRSPDVDHSAGLNLFDGEQQFPLDDTVVNHLVPGNVDDDNADLELRNVLLEFHFAIDGQQDVKFLLRKRQKGTVFEGVPAFVVHRGGLMFAEEQLNARVYALVNEDAHSRIWLLAKSSTVRTCWRVMAG